MDIASVIFTFMLTCRVLTRSIRETGTNSAPPGTAPLFFKLPTRPRSVPHRRHGLHSRVNRVIQGSFGCICLHTSPQHSPSLPRILEGLLVPKASALRNLFRINESRTLGIFSTKCASPNPFAIYSFRTFTPICVGLSQEPGCRYTPLPAVADVFAKAGHPLSFPLCSRRSSVVKQRKTPSISFLFKPLRDSFLHNEGGTPPPPLSNQFCFRSARAGM